MTVEILRLAIAGPLVFSPRRFADTRGFLSEVFREAWFDAHIGMGSFVQENHIYSERAGTIRGLHFQIPPRAQGKLARVTRGAVWDVAVDLREGSPTFGRHVGVELYADNGKQIWVPVGFAHGFCTLEPHSEVTYKITDYYDQEHERGIAWDDADLAVAWPVDSERAVLSDRDRQNPRLRDTARYFVYDSREH